MTLVTIDLGDVAGGHDPDDHVIIRAESFREAVGGGITSTAEVKIPLVDGVGQAEVEPGPVVVSFRCQAVADTREKRGVVPASGTVGIEKVLENAFEYLPPVVNDALETIKDAVAAEVDAIKWDRGHVPLDATSISDLDVGSWNVSNDTRAEIVGTPGLRLGNLSIGSIGTSKTATFISQGNASEKPGMWVQAERLGVWSGWQQVLPAVVPPSDLWYRGYVDESHVTLNDLANGAWGVSGRDHAVRFGLPADFGSLQLMQIGSSRSAFFIGQETGMWIATSQGQVWGEWKRPGATLDELNNVGAGLKTVPVAVSTGAGGAGELSGRYRVLTQVTAPVTRFRVHVSTAHPMWAGDRGPSTLGAVYIGHRSGDAGITNQLTLKTGNSTVAAAGEWVSRWITHDLSRETLIDFQVTADNAYNLIAPAWKQDGASWVQQTTIPLWVWLEVETYAETPTVALVGDSTGAGSGSHMPVWDSALHIHARSEGFIPVLYASSGDLLEGNTDPEDRNYKRWAGFGPYDSVIIQAGSNDIHNGTTLSVMQEHYLAVTEAVAQLSSVVIGATVKPRYPAHPQYDSTRIAYNNWLKTQQGTTRAVLDFSHAVAPGGAIDPTDNADGAHLLSSGHQKMATAFDGVTVARVPLAPKAAMEAADQALGQRIDAEKWLRPRLGLGSTLDTLYGPTAVGIHPVTSAVGGLPVSAPGWVIVLYNSDTGSTTHIYTAASYAISGEWQREYWRGEWQPWRDTSMGAAIQGKADTSYVDAADQSLGERIDAKADKSAVDTTDTALGQRITDEKWVRPGLSSSSTLDDLTGASSVGLYPVTGAVGGLPINSPGTVNVVYDSGSSRTVQVYAPSSPAQRVTMRRVHQGTWRDWEPTTYAGLYVSTGHVDDLIIPHVYAVAGTVAGLPVAENTSLEVMQAGAGTSQLIQRATTLEVRPRTFMRRRQWSRWDKWVEDGKDTSPAPITWDLVETTNADAQLIAGSMSHDRLTLFNSVGGPLRQSRDNGKTWEEVYTWPGSALEVTLPLANGEILVVTNSAYEGQTSMRRVWVSEGYDPDNPQAAKWVHKLTGSSRMVKFPEWSLNTWDNIVLASEYGPKGGMIWAGNPDPIEEGKNARYAYLSTDYGETWKQVFDLNSWLLSRGENTLKRHIHGIAWDPYWDRIWLTFGDHPTDNGSNGILYSDDFGDTWEIAYHSAEVDEHLGFQVVGIQPMRDCVLFAGDMTPAGTIRIDRAGGKYRDVWEFQDAWSLGDEHKILCHVIRHHQDGFGEVAFFGFAREGAASPSIIVATRDGYDWDVLWESDDSPSPGFRWMAGPTMDGQLIASVSRGGVWSELSGKIDLHNFTESQLAARDGRLAAHRELVMTPEQVGRIATEKAAGKAPVVHEHTASQIIDLHHYSGTGFPEGKVSAPVGAIYTDTQATAGAVRWIKTSGTGATGWSVEYGDTGWRSVVPDRERVPSGEMRFRRQGNTVTIRVVGMVHAEPNSGLQNLSVTIPLHFRPTENQIFGLIGNTGGLRSHVFTVYNRQTPYVQRNGIYADLPELDGGYDGQISYVTDDTWPSTLPGIPT